MFEADCAGREWNCVRVCPWRAVAVARDPRRPRGRCVASPCVRYATPPRTSGLRESTTSHGEGRRARPSCRARNRSYKAPIAPPSLRSRARGALYSIRYAYFGWRVSIRLMIHARRNGQGDEPARPDSLVFDVSPSRRSAFSAPPGPGGGHPRARTLGAPARALWRTGPDPVHTS